MQDKQEEKWYLNADNDEIWYGCDYFSSYDEVVEAGLKQIEEIRNGGKCDVDLWGREIYGNIKRFYVGKAEMVEAYIDADDILERIQYNAYGEVGELAEDYLCDVTNEQKVELEEVIYNWFKENKLLPTFYKFSETYCIDVPGENKCNCTNCSCGLGGKKDEEN